MPEVDLTQPKRAYELMSFDPPVVDEDEDLLPKEPEITQEDVENARRSGMKLGVDQGFEAGEKKAREELEQVFAQAAKENDQEVEKVFKQLADQFEVLMTHQQQMMDIYAEQVLRVGTQIWSSLLPEYTATHGLDEVVATVKECLSVVSDGANIVIKYPEQQAEQYQKLLSPLIKTYENRLDVQFQSDLSLQENDVRIAWQGGSVARSNEELLAQVQQLTEKAITDFHAQQEKDRNAMAEAQGVQAVSEELPLAGQE